MTSPCLLAVCASVGQHLARRGELDRPDDCPVAAGVADYAAGVPDY
ncbi:MAG TPA: hypothetical protein VL996_12690 [Methylocella sp.]|nr:hypothetical protein [Methylocella sp.]